MNYICRVDVLHTPQELVKEELYVQIGESLAGTNDLVQVGLHWLHVKIDLVVPVPDIIEVDESAR